MLITNNKELDIKHFLEFKEDFDEMCMSSEFYSDITQSDVQFLVDFIERYIL